LLAIECIVVTIDGSSYDVDTLYIVILTMGQRYSILMEIYTR